MTQMRCYSNSARENNIISLMESRSLPYEWLHPKAVLNTPKISHILF